ncbi:MAG TPA: c-type cytochrome [Burkholderiales bacterium]|nr:c-type cytochrome [Burkholderiales bacterium]
MNKVFLLTALLALLPVTAAAQDAAAGKEKAQVCAACHGADGNSPDPQYPNLAGQTTQYLYVQIRDFKDGRREDPQMSPFAKDLSRKDMFDIAAYYTSQKPNGQHERGKAELVEKGKEVAVAGMCTQCHMGDYSGQNAMSRLAGQHYSYLKKSLLDYKARNRTNDGGVMTSIMRTMADEDIEAMASHIATFN